MNEGTKLIARYFNGLTDEQCRQFDALEGLYAEWNARINVVSRKDLDALYTRHILHSLAIDKLCRFEAGAEVVDVGCGGGFPSVPLAILFPEVNFTAVDSIGKKITVVREVCSGAGIRNLHAVNSRIEAVEGEFDYVVSRAVTAMPAFVGWVWGKLRKGQRGTLPNGILYLKGGDLTEELAATKMTWQRVDISDMFDDEFFETKQVVYTPKV